MQSKIRLSLVKWRIGGNAGQTERKNAAMTLTFSGPLARWPNHGEMGQQGVSPV